MANEFYVYNGKWPKKCKVCKVDLEANKGVSKRPSGVPGDKRWSHCCMDPKCLAKLGANWVQFVADLANNAYKRVQPSKTQSGVFVAVMEPFCNDTSKVIRELGGKWDRPSKGYVLPNSLDRKEIARVLEVAGFEIDPAYVAVNDTDKELLRYLRECKDRKGLYEFQVEGVKALLTNDNYLLADDMGLGKTVQALHALQGEAAIVVAPSSTKLNWLAEVRKWRPDYKAFVVMGSAKRKRDQWAIKDFRAPVKGEIVIVNYAQLPQDLLLWGRDLSEFAGTSLIIDEAHLLKNKDAKRTKKALALSRGCSKVWGLTGTPLMNRPMDLWNTLSVLGLDRKVFGSFSNFLRLMGGSRGAYGIEFRLGSVDSSVPAIMQRAMLRRTKSMALPGLPTKLRNYKVVPMDADLEEIASDLYSGMQQAKSAHERRDELLSIAFDRAQEREQAEQDDMEAYWADLDDYGGGSAPKARRSKSNRGSSIGTLAQLRAELALRKVPLATKIIEDFEEQGKPLIVFSAHVEPVRQLGSREGWATFTGSTPQVKRQQIVEDFRAGRLNGIAGTIGAMGTGITLLTDVGVEDCDTALFIDQSWLGAENQQAEDRICRIHSQGRVRERVNYIYLQWDHPVDRHVKGLVQAKQDTVDQAIGLASDVVLKDPRFASAFSKAKACSNPIGLELSEDEIADLLAEADKSKATAIAMGKWAAYGDRWAESGYKFAQSIGKADNGNSKGNSVVEFDLDPVPFQLKTQIMGAIQDLLSVCDGATQEDGMGFNKPDAALFHTLNLVDFWQSKPISWYIAWRRLRKYQGQIGGRYPLIWSMGVVRKAS